MAVHKQFQGAPFFGERRRRPVFDTDDSAQGRAPARRSRVVNTIVADRKLHDLIEQVVEAWDETSSPCLYQAKKAELRELVDIPADVLGNAAEFLIELREARHRNELVRQFPDQESRRRTP